MVSYIGRGAGIRDPVGFRDGTNQFLGQGSNLLYILFIVGVDIKGLGTTASRRYIVIGVIYLLLLLAGFAVLSCLLGNKLSQLSQFAKEVAVFDPIIAIV